MLTRHGVSTIGTADAGACPGPSPGARAANCSNTSGALPAPLRPLSGRPERRAGACSQPPVVFTQQQDAPSLEVIRAAEAHWQANQATITLAQVEGFIRQILGWREFVRALYWEQMPDYGRVNFWRPIAPARLFLERRNQNGCVRHAIRQSLDHAYAHHIQRLVVTGNFALLAGIHPDEVDAWYLGIYVDAIGGWSCPTPAA